MEARYQHLTRTNAGTPAGDLLRRYWQPVAMSGDLVAGGAPLAERVMGDDIVVFRDEDGRAGALALKCAHRCADLSYGRVEAGGIRCVYHGWVFDVNGACLEQPAEPPESTLKHRVRQRSFAVREAAGAVWAYFGPGEPPLFPAFPALVGDDYRYSTRWKGNANWLQASEGNIDPVHTSFLHQIVPRDPEMRKRWGVFSINARPEVSAVETRFGLRLFTKRRLPDSDEMLLRVTNFVMPNACAVGGFEGDLGPGGCTMLWDVPIDDEHHWRYEFIFHRSGKLDKATLDAQYRSEKINGDEMRRTPENRYLQDRSAMQNGDAYIGLGECFTVHDVFITQSQGVIHDQSGEALGSSDIAITKARRLLAEAAVAVAEGRDPLGVVREPVANDWNDMIVVTQTIPNETDLTAFCDAIAAEGTLYRLAEPQPVV
jgi:phenylpropionate dioxygenase-like ring-hydroxylating dioxygenase large terminal subunit